MTVESGVKQMRTKLWIQAFPFRIGGGWWDAQSRSFMGKTALRARFAHIECLTATTTQRAFCYTSYVSYRRSLWWVCEKNSVCTTLLYKYICIYIERERELAKYVHIHMIYYIYNYIYLETAGSWAHVWMLPCLEKPELPGIHIDRLPECKLGHTRSLVLLHCLLHSALPLPRSRQISPHSHRAAAGSICPNVASKQCCPSS